MSVRPIIEPGPFKPLVLNRLRIQSVTHASHYKTAYSILRIEFQLQSQLCVSFLTIVMLNLTRRKREVLPELQQNWMLHGHLLRLRFPHQSNRWHNFQCLIFSLHRHTHMLKQKNIARVFPFKVIRIPESEKCLRVKSEILDFGIRNSA